MPFCFLTLCMTMPIVLMLSSSSLIRLSYLSYSLPKSLLNPSIFVSAICIFNSFLFHFRAYALFVQSVRHPDLFHSVRPQIRQNDGVNFTMTYKSANTNNSIASFREFLINSASSIIACSILIS